MPALMKSYTPSAVSHRFNTPSYVFFGAVWIYGRLPIPAKSTGTNLFFKSHNPSLITIVFAFGGWDETFPPPVPITKPGTRQPNSSVHYPPWY
jgi:hypothetical protein